MYVWCSPVIILSKFGGAAGAWVTSRESRLSGNYTSQSQVSPRRSVLGNQHTCLLNSWMPGSLASPGTNNIYQEQIACATWCNLLKYWNCASNTLSCFSNCCISSPGIIMLKQQIGAGYFKVTVHSLPLRGTKWLCRTHSGLPKLLVYFLTQRKKSCFKLLACVDPSPSLTCSRSTWRLSITEAVMPNHEKVLVFAC